MRIRLTIFYSLRCKTNSGILYQQDIPLLTSCILFELSGLEVKCTHYVMELTISRFLRPNLVIDSLHLQDATCKVSFVNDTHAFLNAPLDGCGTQQRTSEEYFIYINTMTGDEKSSKSRAEITRKGRLKFEFQCSFKKLQVLSIVSYSPRQKGVSIADGK